LGERPTACSAPRRQHGDAIFPAIKHAYLEYACYALVLYALVR